MIRRRRLRVRNQLTGRVLPCCWADCWVAADSRHTVKVPHDAPRWKGEQLAYVFCSERHEALWKHSHRHRGRLPAGSRGLLGPLGLPIS